MKVYFKKDSDNNFILHCVRADESETFHKYKFGTFQVEHDILHFVVEKTLGFTEAFYGIIASGKNIEWFTERTSTGTSKGKESMRGEAEAAELIVGALQTLRNDAEFFQHLGQISTQKNKQHLLITQEQVVEIRNEAANLLDQWEKSKEGIVVMF